MSSNLPDEVNELGGGINLRLNDGFALPQHGGGVQILPIFAGHENGRFLPDGETLGQGHLVPLELCLGGHIYGFLDKFLRELKTYSLRKSFEEKRDISFKCLLIYLRVLI